MAVTFNFFLLHLNLSYTKRIVLLVPVENIKIRNITTLFFDWPNWIVINVNIIVINITVRRLLFLHLYMFILLIFQIVINIII